MLHFLFYSRGDSDKRYLSVTSSCWEVASRQINLQNVLGSGSFGEVWKAVACGLKRIPGETTVAVKKLKRKITLNTSNFQL